MDRTNPLQTSLQFYFGSWIFGFVSTLLIAFCANTIWKIPLEHVVDVQLSVSFSLLLLFAGIYVLIAVIMLVTGNFLAAVIWLLAVALLSLSAYAPVLAFSLFGWMTGQVAAENSALLPLFYRAEALVTAPVAQTAHIVLSGVSVDTLINWTERGLQIISIIIAVASLVSAGKARAAAAANA